MNPSGYEGYDDPAYVKATLDEAVAEMVPEAAGHIAAQVFHREGTWANEGGLTRFFSKVLGRGDAAGPPEPEKNNLLVLTEDRVYLVGCKPKGGKWRATKPVGDWPVEDLRVHAREERVEYSHDASAGGATSRKVDTIKLGLEIVPEDRTLELEGTVWGRDETTRRTVEALLSATGGGEVA